jgi:hypothetical protein
MTAESKIPTSLFERIWPVTFIGISLIASVTWAGIIGYAMFRLSAFAF